MKLEAIGVENNLASLGVLYLKVRTEDGVEMDFWIPPYEHQKLIDRCTGEPCICGTKHPIKNVVRNCIHDECMTSARKFSNYCESHKLKAVPSEF